MSDLPQGGLVHAPPLAVFAFMTVAVGAFEVALLRHEQVEPPDLVGDVPGRPQFPGRRRLAAIIIHEGGSLSGPFTCRTQGYGLAYFQLLQGCSRLCIHLEQGDRLGQKKVVLVAPSEYVEVLTLNYRDAPVMGCPAISGFTS